MSRRKAIALAIFTAVPVLEVFAGIIYAMNRTPQEALQALSSPSYVFSFMAYAYLHFFTVMALVIIYDIYLFRTDRVPTRRKPLWAFVLLVFNVLVMPVFWYLYIWRFRPEQVAR